MILKELIKNVEVLGINGDINVDCDNVAINSNNVRTNSAFICLKGVYYDGNKFSSLAAKNGANVIVTEDECYILGVTIVKVKNARKAFSQIAANFYENPADKLNIVAVVGTNGKSTTAYITYKLLQLAGYSVGLLGTMYYEYDGVRRSATLTTPDPLDLNMMFRDMVNSGIKYVVMEVSAHAIFHNKMYGIQPRIKIFTNFSQDHLDFFEDLTSYRDCKKSYFLNDQKSELIVNMDDSLGVDIIKEVKRNVITYGLTNPSDVFCIDIENTSDGSAYILNLLDSIMTINTRLFGIFNIYNTMAAAICAKLLGVSDFSINKSLCEIEPPEGRFNVFNINNVKYIVDFAHTPDGLYNLLKEARKISKGRLITIFGCGGDRDVSKRPMMGKIASIMSDVVIITTDNPRTESRAQIISDILQGVKNRERVYIQLDRRKAIKLGSEMSKYGDIVIIAGKGSENYIDENNTKTPYSDLEEVKKIGV